MRVPTKAVETVIQGIPLESISDQLYFALPYKGICL